MDQMLVLLVLSVRLVVRVHSYCLTLGSVLLGVQAAAAVAAEAVSWVTARVERRLTRILS
jgi:hypothetical protein